ncbi:hypothetical protein HF521_002883 [Silurus meridionalis]|uniref:Uncharacterized protein n=1 Tax=Silurus meridionalis TaxID=175797 RepID=A0A8T0B350_SILME|nr:hypothetical protein HF521_002883 [Silurus meridionalis]
MNGKGSTASCSSGNNKAENTGEFCDDSPPKKMKASGAISAPEDGAGGFKAAWSDAVKTSISCSQNTQRFCESEQHWTLRRFRS